MSVCLLSLLYVSVRENISVTTSKLYKFIRIHVARDGGSVLLWRRCNMICTSGFVDDVSFPYNGSFGGVTLSQQPRCNVVHRLTPPLRGINCVTVSSCPKTKAGAKSKRVSHASAAAAEYSIIDLFVKVYKKKFCVR